MTLCKHRVCGAGTHLLFQHQCNLQGGERQPQHGFQFGQVRVSYKNLLVWLLSCAVVGWHLLKGHLESQPNQLTCKDKSLYLLSKSSSPFFSSSLPSLSWQVWQVAIFNNSPCWARTSAHGRSVGQRWRHRPHSSGRDIIPGEVQNGNASWKHHHE